MDNVGAYNPVIGALFFFLCSLPITFMMASALVRAFYSKTQYITVEKIVEVEVPKTVYVDRYRYPTAKPKRTKKTKAPLKTPDKVKTEALKGLKNIGFSSTEGRDLIYKTIQQKYYKDAEQLLKDCMANI
jgi:hypothetical protein